MNSEIITDYGKVLRDNPCFICAHPVRHEACVNINTYKDERTLQPNLPFRLKYI